MLRSLHVWDCPCGQVASLGDSDFRRCFVAIHGEERREFPYAEIAVQRGWPTERAVGGPVPVPLIVADWIAGLHAAAADARHAAEAAAAAAAAAAPCAAAQGAPYSQPCPGCGGPTEASADCPGYGTPAAEGGRGVMVCWPPSSCGNATLYRCAPASPDADPCGWWYRDPVGVRGDVAEMGARPAWLPTPARGAAPADDDPPILLSQPPPLLVRFARAEAAPPPDVPDPRA